MNFELKEHRHKERTDFTEKYNQWLASLEKGSVVNIRSTNGYGEPVLEAATIKSITENRIITEQTRQNGLRVWLEHYRVRPKSSGMPKIGETVLEPRITPEITLTYELATILGGYYEQG